MRFKAYAVDSTYKKNGSWNFANSKYLVDFLENKVYSISREGTFEEITQTRPIDYFENLAPKETYEKMPTYKAAWEATADNKEKIIRDYFENKQESYKDNKDSLSKIDSLKSVLNFNDKQEAVKLKKSFWQNKDENIASLKENGFAIKKLDNGDWIAYSKESISNKQIKDVVSGVAKGISTMAKEQPLEAKSLVNSIVVKALEVKNEKIGRVGYWGATKVPLARASLEHRLRVNKPLSIYKEFPDYAPGIRPNCQCTVYFKKEA